MVEIADIIPLANDGFARRNTAGRADIGSGELTDADLGVKYVRVIDGLFDVDKDAILNDGAHFLVAVSGRFIGGADQAAFLEFFDMSGEGSVADVQLACKLVHTHLVVFQKDV